MTASLLIAFLIAWPDPRVHSSSRANRATALPHEVPAANHPFSASEPWPGSLLPSVRSDSIEVYYAHKRTADLSAWCNRLKSRISENSTRRDGGPGGTSAGRVESRDADLQCRYRLFPITRDKDLVADLPTTLEPGTSRGLALLSGLWGYRASDAGFVNAVRYGRRAQDILERARLIDPEDPFVLLVDGHSLLFKPRIAGGSKQKAADRFAELASMLQDDPDPDVYPEEALTWQWFALAKDGSDRADSLKTVLLHADLPLLFRELLESDP